MKNHKLSAGFAFLPVLLVVLFLLVVGGGGYTYYSAKQQASQSDVACTMEAKVCPDGSSVGRSGPNCEFAACPQTQANTDTSTKAAPVSGTILVPGMSKYTDSSFGFSFWYPSGWTINSPAGDEPGIGANLEDCTFKKSFSIHGNQLSNGVSIGEYYCPNLSMTLRGVNSTNPVGVDLKYYFDTNTHTWMVTDLSDSPNGSPRTTRPVDVRNNTMGGLHIFPGVERFGADVVIPLSATHFLIVASNDGGNYVDERVFAKTILATDPSVATPVSAAQQTATIQAEQKAYAGL